MGENNLDMIGTSGDPTTLPEIPNGFVQGTNFAIYVENGGHITPYINSEGGVCNIGHNQDGGFGDGTTDDRDSYECIVVTIIGGELCGLTGVGSNSMVTEDDLAVTLPETPVDIDVLTNDSGVADTTTLSTGGGLLSPSNGSVSVNLTTGIISYTPNPAFEGIDSFEYVVCDTITPIATCDTALVTVTVTSCPATASEKIIMGTVFNDLNENGSNDTEAGLQSVDVKIYEDINQDGLIDAGDVLLSTEATDASGNYSYTADPIIKTFADDFSGTVFSGTDNNSGSDNWVNDFWIRDGANGNTGDVGTYNGSDSDFNFSSTTYNK